jgi:hypothetical protein
MALNKAMRLFQAQVVRHPNRLLGEGCFPSDLSVDSIDATRPTCASMEATRSALSMSNLDDEEPRSSFR